MRSNLKILKFVRGVYAIAICLLATGISSPAQTPGTGQITSSPAVVQQQSQVQTPTDDTRAPIYGLQGVLIETLDGKIVSAQAADQPFNRASSIKLATALVALRNFGPDHRFNTGFWS